MSSAGRPEAALTVPGKALAWEGVRWLVINAVRSPHTKRLYAAALEEFGHWCAANSATGLTRAAVQRYRAALEARGLAASSINVRLAAVRKLAHEAAENGLLAPEAAASIVQVKGARRLGVRAGNCLTREQAEALLAAPDPATNQGRRDRALLALLIGCGLRREELAQLRIEDIQQRDGRWCIVDLAGRGKRLRTVPMPDWAKAWVDDWLDRAGFTSGPVLGAVNKADRITGQGMGAQSIYEALQGYGKRLGVAIAPHDLRRTFAKLAHQGRAPLEQIQLSLGHASLQTTQRYLGVRQDLTDAPCDHLGLQVLTRDPE